MYQVWIAYILWLVGFFGCLGFHRWYLGKKVSAVVWLFTGGLGFLGSAYDFLTMTNQVSIANARLGLRDPSLVDAPAIAPRPSKAPLERVVLELAREHSGRVTPALVAGESDWSLAQAQKQLDSMVRKGLCQQRITKDGITVYHFWEFDPQANHEFEV